MRQRKQAPMHMESDNQRRSRGWADIGLIALAMVAITVIHYQTSYEKTEYHAFTGLLYYIPIIIAAFRFGIKGGVAAGLVTSVLFAPYIIAHADKLSPELTVKVLDVLLYNGIGWVTGLLAEAEKRQKRRYLEALANMRVLNRQLQERAETIARINAELEQRVREKNLLEEQVRRADKLAALGVLVAGVAHELRNPLGILKGSVQVMARELGDIPAVKEYTDVFTEECTRMQRTVDAFLAFARPSPPHMRVTDINAVAADALKFMEPLARRHNIALNADLDPGLPLLQADAEQLRQVFVNLALNSVQAMAGGGEINVTSRREGRFALVVFADTGPGIPEDKLPHIFDPFFTTKDGGTGLGLAVAHRIIDAHGGVIEATSAQGRGTVIRVYLPLPDDENLRSGEQIHGDVADH